ncbi:conserved hypothetical protein [Microbacterium sp. 8M]|nr:conserved hypothetical protein [Microbacterium sp. 8M]
MHLDRRPHQDRLQDVPLDLLHGEHHDEHPQGDPRTVVDEREEHRERARDDRADDRDEGSEEHQHRDGDGERHAEQEGAQADAEGVDERHEHLRAGVVDHGRPAVARGGVDGAARVPREELHGPRPDPAAVGEHAEQDEQGQHGAGGDMAEGRADRDRARLEQLALFAEELRPLVEQIRDLRPGEMERPVDEELLQLLPGADRARLHAVPLLRDLPDREPQQPSHDRDGADQRDDDREPARPAHPQHRAEHGPEQGREQDGDHQRDDQDLEEHHEPDHDAEGGRDREETPGVRRGDLQAGGQGALHVVAHIDAPRDGALPDEIAQPGCAVLTHRPSLRAPHGRPDAAAGARRARAPTGRGVGGSRYAGRRDSFSGRSLPRRHVERRRGTADRARGAGLLAPAPGGTGSAAPAHRDGAYGCAADRLRERIRPVALSAAVLPPGRVRPGDAGARLPVPSERGALEPLHRVPRA